MVFILRDCGKFHNSGDLCLLAAREDEISSNLAVEPQYLEVVGK